jgi:hypothetical protein
MTLGAAWFLDFVYIPVFYNIKHNVSDIETVSIVR